MSIAEQSPSEIQIRKPYISASQMESFCRCPEAYRRRYIEKHIIPPAIVMMRGTGLHTGAAHNMRQKIESHVDLPASQIVEASVASFESECEKAGLVPNAETGKAKDELTAFAELHAKEQAPDYQPVMVEETVRVELPNSSRDLLGIIDLADTRKIVTDFKTSGKRKPQGEADTSVQLSTYAVAYHAKFGEPPALVQLDVLVNNKTPIRQVVSSTRDINDIQALANRIESVTRAIDAGSFPPATPGAWWCSERSCGYWRSCPYVNSERKAKQQETEE